MVRIVIPVINEAGLDAQVAEHFGRTPLFAIIDLDKSGKLRGQKIVPNAGEHFGGGGKRAGFILSMKPDVIIVHGMGARGIGIYQSERVAVLRANQNTVKGLIDAYSRNELEELTQGCHEARNP